MNLQIKFFSVGCGDAISIRFLGNDGKFHHILVDGGFKSSYSRTFKTHIQEIQNLNEIIDLWVLTHIDNDHINGCVAFFEDVKVNQKNLVREFWYNYSHTNQPLISDAESDHINSKQGITLRDKILAQEIPIHEAIFNELPTCDFFGAKITILSPDKEGLNALREDWQRENESDYINSHSDYDHKIIDLSNRSDTREDKNDIANKSSIAFLFEYQGYKILFGGDAHTSVIIQNLLKRKKDLFPDTEKLKIDYLKLAHHGSEKNYNASLLNIIECQNFVICANGGGTHNLPKKEVLAKILSHPHRDKTQKINFIFSCTVNRNMFEVDGHSVFTEYNFQCLFPTSNQLHYSLNF